MPCGVLKTLNGECGMMWKNKNVLVTGGMGLVGGHLVERLVELEANVVVTKIINDHYIWFFYINIWNFVFVWKASSVLRHIIYAVIF